MVTGLVSYSILVERGFVGNDILGPIKPQVLPPDERPYQPQDFAPITSKPAEPVNIPKVLYLTELPEANYRLKRSIAIFLEQGQEGWLAFRDDVGIYSYGTTLDEAITNFVASLLDDYDLYTSSAQEELTEGAFNLANWLREVIERR